MTASEERSPFLFCHIIYFPAKYTSVSHLKVSHRAKQKRLTLYDIETKEQQVYQMDDSCACVASAMIASSLFTTSAMSSLCCSAGSSFSSGKTPQSADCQRCITGAAGEGKSPTAQMKHPISEKDVFYTAQRKDKKRQIQADGGGNQRNTALYEEKEIKTKVKKRAEH